LIGNNRDFMSRVAAVIFDFDGVLADTERLHLAAFQDVFRLRGWTLDEETYFDRYLGCDDEGLVAAYARDHALTLADHDRTTLVEAKTRVFSQHLSSGAVLFPGARACVTSLAQTFRLGIASGALRSEIESILRAGDLLRYFPVIVGADDVEACKPSPVPYLTAAARLGIDPRSCVAIEDSAPGLAAAHAAGMRTIALTTTSPRPLLAAADHIIDSLDELSALVFSAAGPL
jgi:beta-phosphoglucomutase-like phosphatase (HAD superfamily)